MPTVLLPVTRPWAMERVCAAIEASDIPRDRLILVLDAPGCEAWEGALSALGFDVDVHATGNPSPPATWQERRPRHRTVRVLTQALVPDGPLLCLEDDTLVPPDVWAKLSAIGPHSTGVQAGRHEMRGIGVSGAPGKSRVEDATDCGHYCLYTTGEDYKRARIIMHGSIDRKHTAQLRPLRVDWECVCGHLTGTGVLWP
ncbi:MAG: hypothetical protein U1E29_18250 [Coriobacteriia bacterium]|nr:hypothetical protein [Coriobacteriia bacterium]